MKVLLATGNHPRHIYLAQLLKENGFLHALITEEREKLVPVPPSGLEASTEKHFTTHFLNREASEEKFFGVNSFEFENQLRIKPGTINSKESVSFVQKNNPDVYLTAGVGIIKDEVLKILPRETWNIHGGLSPWYKGAITHFWPSYQLEPQFTGCTVHYINSKIDAGNIIHQTPSVLMEGDGLQQLAARSLKLGFDQLIPLLRLLKKQKSISSIEQRNNGKLWLKSDWTPQHLNLIYSLYNDRIVDAYLEGKLQQRKPHLFEQKF